jgi:hypothetical protein
MTYFFASSHQPSSHTPLSKETRHQLVRSIFTTPSSLLKELFVVKVPFTFTYKQDEIFVNLQLHNNLT